MVTRNDCLRGELGYTPRREKGGFGLIVRLSQIMTDVYFWNIYLVA
jgi:hypothetical protein